MKQGTHSSTTYNTQTAIILLQDGSSRYMYNLSGTHYPLPSYQGADIHIIILASLSELLRLGNSTIAHLQAHPPEAFKLVVHEVCRHVYTANLTSLMLAVPATFVLYKLSMNLWFTLRQILGLLRQVLGLLFWVAVAACLIERAKNL